MPRVKIGNEPYIEVARLIRGYGVTATALGRILGISKATALKKAKNPEKLTLAELGAIVRSTEIPADEMRGAIKFGG